MQDQANTEKQKEKNENCKKIEQLYQNYGIDTSNMTDEEFERLDEMYSKFGRNLDADLRESEKHKDKYSEDVI